MKRLLTLTLFLGLVFGQTNDKIEDYTKVEFIKTYNESKNRLELMEFWEKGKPKDFKTYDKKEGKWELVLQVKWFDNGQKQIETTYKGVDEWGYPKEHGKNTMWFPNGQKMNEGMDIDGKKEGLWTVWSFDGRKKKEMFFKSDPSGVLPISEKIWEKCWDESGNNCICGEMFNSGCK